MLSYLSLVFDFPVGLAKIGWPLNAVVLQDLPIKCLLSCTPVLAGVSQIRVFALHSAHSFLVLALMLALVASRIALAVSSGHLLLNKCKAVHLKFVNQLFELVDLCLLASQNVFVLFDVFCCQLQFLLCGCQLAISLNFKRLQVLVDLLGVVVGFFLMFDA